MSETKKIPLLGDFGHQPVIGFFQPTLEVTYPTTTHFGLVCDALVPNGTFRDEDGNLWNIIRYWDHHLTTGMRISTTRNNGKLYDALPESTSAYRGPVMHRIEGDVHIAEGTSMPHRGMPGEMEPFSFLRTVETVDWEEGSLLSIKGRHIGPGIVWYAPYRNGGWMWTSHIIRASGEILGKKVEGFFGYDQIWAPPGVNWLNIYSEMGMAWFVLGNEYEDGTFEVGHIGQLKGDLRFAMIADENGPLVCTRDVSVEFELGEHDYPNVIHWFIDGEEWRWEREPGGEVGHPTQGIYRGSEGHGRKVGDTRKLKVWYGWGDFWADGRSLPFVRKR